MEEKKKKEKKKKRNKTKRKKKIEKKYKEKKTNFHTKLAIKVFSRKLVQLPTLTIYLSLTASFP